MRFIHNLSVLILTVLTITVNAEENVGQKGKTSKKQYSSSRAATCTAPTSNYDLFVNNVRARIMNGGDLWWDLSGEALYYVPSTGQVSSLFAGAIWIGGYDEANNLKVAAQTYRQSGTDFYAGPLLDDGGTTDDATCKAFDDHYAVTRADIDSAIAVYERKGGNLSPADIAPSILNWPAADNPNNVITTGYNSLASYVEVDNQPGYNPLAGDYPVLDLAGGQCSAEKVKPDEMVWWVYNDRGNIHGETGSEAIGIEIQGTAFGFKTNDAINDMTFYRYRIANKSSNTLYDTYMAQWVDADLGFAFDDFVGCDPSRQLGICYNGDAEDGPAPVSYGKNPPMVGVDFFQGPVDTAGNELGMAVFLYYNNDQSVTGNPDAAPDYYGYLSGSWKDGQPFTEGGNGYGGSVLSNYIFPGDPSDPDGWSECTENNEPADRRFLQSSGPFVLKPGAVNNVTVGVVWVQQANSERCSSFSPIQEADDQAQALFNNCFKLLEGPKMPGVEVRELDKQIVLTISDYDLTESYYEVDPKIQAFDPTNPDSAYTFQGYTIYQLADGSVSESQLNDPQLARVVAVVDREDEVKSMVNFSYDPDYDMLVGEVKVPTASDQGIRHTFLIEEDLFATGSSELINDKAYYFAVMPYGYNPVHDHLSEKYAGDGSSLTKPYIESRDIKIPFLATPHEGRSDLEINAKFGDAPVLKRIQGRGNGGNELEITDASVRDILENSYAEELEYVGRSAPIDVFVYDPLKVPDGEFTIVINHTDTASTRNPDTDEDDEWEITFTPGENSNLPAATIKSDTSLGSNNEQILADYGLAIKVKHTLNAATLDTSGNPLLKDNGLLSASIEYEDPSKPWLYGVPDELFGKSAFNWIRSGSQAEANITNLDDIRVSTSTESDFMDPNEDYESILDGTWAPYALTNYQYFYYPSDNEDDKYYVLTPGLHSGTNSSRVVSNNIDRLSSVDIVFTPNKEDWSLTLVLEGSDEADLSADGINKLQVRTAMGVDKDSLPMATSGYGYFPGYAINVETGERLNILFAEDTWLASENGNDMIWNPTSSYFTGVFGSAATENYKYGGKHYVYVMDSRYSSSTLQEYKTLLEDGSNSAMEDVFEHAMWVTVPMLNGGYSFESYDNGFIPTKATVKLRVQKPISEYIVNTSDNGSDPIKYTFSTSDLAAVEKEVAIDTILQQVNVVPNPYYGYSEYETSQLNNRIKITNLPDYCVIRIFSVDGQLIRRFNRSVTSDADGNTNTTLEWDLKNQQGIMVASGLYLINVEVPGVGSRTLQWFGVMRPLDLDSF